MFPENWTFSIADGINDFVDQIVKQYGSNFETFTEWLLNILMHFEHILRIAPWWVVLAVIFALAWTSTRKISVSALVTGALFLVGCLGLWDNAMQTLALMLVSVFASVLLGIPVGIMLAQSSRLRALVLPMLDVMQTMPSFVYLIPALMLFGLGKVPAIFATVIYSLPPLIRLTDLGIRLVDREVMQASNAFGLSKSSQLFNVQLPLALPTIMAGVNQTTMMSLSMVVLASMIGARGLGENVLLGIQRLDVGKGTEAGIAIVALAIVLDRITQAFGKSVTTPS